MNPADTEEPTAPPRAACNDTTDGTHCAGLPTVPKPRDRKRRFSCLRTSARGVSQGTPSASTESDQSDSQCSRSTPMLGDASEKLEQPMRDVPQIGIFPTCQQSLT